MKTIAFSPAIEWQDSAFTDARELAEYLMNDENVSASYAEAQRWVRIRGAMARFGDENGAGAAHHEARVRIACLPEFEGYAWAYATERHIELTPTVVVMLADLVLTDALALWAKENRE